MPDSNIHSGHRRRVKDEFRKLGLDHFPPHKILELLLFYTIPRGDTNEISHHLIERFGSVSGVLSAPLDLLERSPGIGPESAAYLKMIGSVARLYREDGKAEVKSVRTTEQAKDFMRRQLTHEQVECFQMLCLGRNGNILYSEQIFQGNSGKVDIVISDILHLALSSRATKVVIAHNHPGGICNPSREDLHTTGLISNELRRLDIELTDHIIVADDGVCSMAELKMLP
ncbi:MAG: hypothetical protein FWE19_06695 [Oscillospiraceae bacterium]|nr:hypothetical protein [Oscillospiraceae bacterium]